MSVFFDEAEADALLYRARTTTPASPDDFGPGTFVGTARGLGLIPGALQARAEYGLATALEGSRGSLETIDRVLGTSTADFLTTVQQETKKNAAAFIPRPWELGPIGGAIHQFGIGAAELLGPTLLASPAGPGWARAAGAAYTTWVGGLNLELQLRQQADEMGLVGDPEAITRAAFTSAGLQGLSIFFPGAITGGIPGLTLGRRLAAEAAGQMGINVGTGIVQRGEQARQLRAGGYDRLAELSQPFGLSDVLIDAGMALVLTPLGLGGHYRVAGHVPATPAIDGAMAARNLKHAAVDTLPGLPQTGADAEAHLEAMVRATEQALAGEPVTADAGAAKFDPLPDFLVKQQQEQARAIEDAVAEVDADAAAIRADTIGAPPPPKFELDQAPLAKLAPEQADILRRLYREAADRKPAFDVAVARVAASVDGKAVLPDLKGADRAVEKILVDNEGDASTIKDLLRATVSVDDIRGVDRAIAGIRAEFTGAILKRNLFTEADSPLDGYRDALLNVAVDGHVAEVQVSVPEMLAAKDRLHALYAERAAIMRAAAAAKREMTEAEMARFFDLSATMRAGYEDAFTRYLKRSGDMWTPRAAESTEIGVGLPPTQRSATPLSNDTGSPSTSKKTARGPKAGSSIGSDMAASTDGSVAQSTVDVKASTPATDLSLSHYGNSGEVVVGTDYVPHKWALVEADKLAPAVEKGEGQARDRTRAASEQQVAQIAANLDFKQIADSPTMATGAPVLSREGVMVAGNGRTLAIQRAYREGTAANYRQALERDAARFGFDTAEVASMKAPALVRVLQVDVDVRAAAIQSNEGGAMRMSLLEQAPVDAARLPPIDDFNVPEDGNLNAPGNRHIVMAWVKNFPGSEQAALVDASGALSQDGMIRLRNAILFKAYGDSPVLSRLVELTEPGAKNIANALAKAGAPIAAARSAIMAGNLHSIDIVPDVIAAVEKLSALRAEGLRVADFLAQGELLGASLSPEARRVLAFMDENMRSSKRIADMLAGFYRRLEAVGNPKEGDMFGGGVPTKESLLDGAIADAETPANPTLGLFDPSPDPYPGTVQAPRSKAQRHYDANGRVEQAEADAPAFEAAVNCEVAA